MFHTLGVGGAEVWLLELLRYFRQHAASLPVRLHVDVCLTGGQPSVFDGEAAALRARLFYMPYGRTSTTSFVNSYRRLLRSGRYDVVHDHQDYSAGIRLLMGAGRLPAVRVVHFHNTAEARDAYTIDGLRRTFVKMGGRSVRGFATHVLGTSEQVLREHGFAPDDLSSRPRSMALYCGFDVNGFQGDAREGRARIAREFGFDANDRVLLFVGRLNQHADVSLNTKNPTFALDVAAACRRHGMPVRLIMAGAVDGARAQLDAYVAARGLKDVVRIAGPRDDVPRLMLGSDLLLFPSLAEGLGMVAVEAQAAGLRVLASAAVPREAAVVPGLIEFRSVAEGAEAWAQAIDKLLHRRIPPRAECNSRVAASRFSIARSARDLLTIYASAVRQPAVV